MTVNCFYFGKFGYTIVPWQIEEDLDRIADMGVTYITLNVLEQDFKAAHENIDLVISLSQKRNLKVLAAPDGWGNLVGNFSGFPSVQAVKKQKYCFQNNAGNQVMTERGWLLDPNNNQTIKFFKKKVKEVLEKFDFDGIYWYHPDHRQDIVETSVLFGELQKYTVEEYSEKEVFYHPKTIEFFEYCGIKQSPKSIILPKNLNDLNSFKQEKDTLVSFYDYPPDVAQPQQLMDKIKTIFKSKIFLS